MSSPLSSRLARALPATTLDRYILGQAVDYFILALVVFTLIVFFSDQVMDFLGQMGKFNVPWTTAFALLGLNLPNSVGFILPASAFMAVMMTYNALNNQFELIAMRMNGISLRRLLLPALVIGLLASALAYWLGDFVAPTANRLSLQLKSAVISQATLPSGKSSLTFPLYDDQHHLQKLVFISRYQDRALQASTIIDLSQRGVLQVTQAKSGQIDPPDNWVFNSANTYTVFKNRDVLAFNHQGVLRVRNLLRGEGASAAKTPASEQARIADPMNADSNLHNFASLFQRVQRREEAGRRVSNKTYVNLWEKITLPLSCLALVICAVPLALTSPRRLGNRGFLFSLGALFLLYVLRALFINLGLLDKLTLGGLLSPSMAMLLACWLPIAIIAGLGLALLARKSRVL
ncbi:MAG: LptF/LptG family permease [Vampirovibrionales bacterium]|nr:LptF/LptG family permease [Vampirovibrionales bacterium]